MSARRLLVSLPLRLFQERRERRVLAVQPGRARLTRSQATPRVRPGSGVRTAIEVIGSAAVLLMILAACLFVPLALVPA